MRMDAHLHSILAYAGIDPVEFTKDLAREYGYRLTDGLDVTKTVNARLPTTVFNDVSIAMWNGSLTLFLATGSDEGDHIEVMRIGSKMHIRFTLDKDADTETYALLKGGPRDLRKDRGVGTLREPRHGKPAWILDGIGQVQIRRHAIDIWVPESFVDIPVEIDIDMDGDESIAA